MPDVSNGNEVDGLYIALEAEFSKAIDDFEAAKSETDRLQKNLEDLDSTSKKTASRMDDMGDSIKDASKKFDVLSESLDDVERQTSDSTEEIKDSEQSVDKLTQSISELVKALKKEIDASEDVERQHRETRNETERLTKETEGLKDETDNANSSFGDMMDEINNLKVGGVLGIATLTGAMVELMKQASDAATEFEKMEGSIRTSVEVTEEELGELSGIASELYSSYAIERGDAATVIATLRKVYDVEGDALDDLSSKYFEFAEVTGMDAVSAVNDLQLVFNKWGIGVEKQAETMDMLFLVTKAYNISMPQLISLLDESDKSFQTMGKSIKEAAVAMGMLTNSDGASTAIDFASSAERLLTQIINNTGSEYTVAKNEFDAAVNTVTETNNAYLETVAKYKEALASGNESTIASAEAAMKEAEEAYTEAIRLKAAAEKAAHDAYVASGEEAAYVEYNRVIEAIRNAENEDAALVAVKEMGYNPRLLEGIVKAYWGGMEGFEEEAKKLDGQGIHEAYEETLNLDDQFKILANTISESLVPAGEVLNGILEDMANNADTLAVAVGTVSNFLAGWTANLINDTEAVTQAVNNMLKPLFDWVENTFGTQLSDNPVDSMSASYLMNTLQTGNPLLAVSKTFSDVLVDSFQNGLSAIPTTAAQPATTNNNVVVNQTFTTTAPLNSAQVKQASEYGVIKASKKLTTTY